MTDWEILQTSVNEYRAQFPTSYDPDASWGVLWWGSGNFVARDMALLYLVTGDQAYAEDILRLLELVRAHTPQAIFLTNFDAPNGRGEEVSGGIISHPQYGAVVIQSALFAYFELRDTNLMDDSQRNVYDKFFQHQAELLEQAAISRGNDTPLDGIRNRNVPFAANVAALTIARAFPDDSAMQDLDARLWPRLEWQIANWWEADGGWGENTQNYGFSMLESLLLLAETSLRNAGPDLYAQTFEGRTIQSMCRFYLEIATPEGGTPALNDTSHYVVDPGLFQLCGFRTNDPQLYFAEKLYNAGRHESYGVDASAFTTPFHILAWADLGNQLPETPDFTSVLLPTTGAAILRDGWERDSQYMLLQFTGSRVHEEYSYGTLYLYAYGPWLVGNGYNIPAGRPTNQHSTLAMDNSNQTNTGGELIAFADLGSTGIAAVTSRSYANLQHTRLVLWNEPWAQWIVIDDAVSDMYQHTLQQYWYVRGQNLLTNENIWTFGQDGERYSLTIEMEPGIPAIYSSISREYDWETWVSNAIGVRMDVTYPGRPVRLVTSLSVTPQGDTSPTITRTDSLEGTQIDSQAEETTWTWILPPIGSPGGTTANYVLSGTAGCTAHQGEILLGYCLMNGTNLGYLDQVLVVSSESIYVETDFASGNLFLSAQEETIITFYWPRSVTNISDSGSALDFSSDNGLVTTRIAAGQHILEIR
ncbi:MAG: hypothetical protein HY781_02435 [Chloroflexi bacterium]|nr:hypothetical protein [Chloroflexota bacterium]